MESMEKFEKQNLPDDQWRRLSDIDLIKRGASYEITGVPLEVATELEREQAGELFTDVASYIRANKVISCPREELSEEAAEILKDATGQIRMDDFGKFYFVDSDGNVATFEIPLSKIRSLEGKTRANLRAAVSKELEENGFKFSEDNGSKGDIYDIMFWAIINYQRKAAEKEKLSKKDQFDF